MRITAGILMIIGGIMGSILLIGNLSILGVIDPFSDTASIVVALGLFLGILAVIGGIYTLMRKHWGWALTGVICSILIGFFAGGALFIPT